MGRGVEGRGWEGSGGEGRGGEGRGGGEGGGEGRGGEGRGGEGRGGRGRGRGRRRETYMDITREEGEGRKEGRKSLFGIVGPIHNIIVFTIQ